jgi:hypothetical protein
VVAAGDGNPRRWSINDVDFIGGKIMTTVEAALSKNREGA